jgi:hypothetical protein
MTGINDDDAAAARFIHQHRPDCERGFPIVVAFIGFLGVRLARVLKERE